ncbi:MAG: SCO family protein [Rhodanobacteraceae bacterium]|nr:SCO family protein [Rhodanobacteraceae bacterium]
MVLTDQTVDAKRLAGKYQLVFFGFTHCPDVCPTALAVMREIDRGLASAKLNDRVGFLFVSVDPERDDLKTLGEYAKYFSPNIRAATADHERLGALTREMGVLYVRAQTMRRTTASTTVPRSSFSMHRGD